MEQRKHRISKGEDAYGNWYLKCSCGLAFFSGRDSAHEKRMERLKQAVQHLKEVEQARTYLPYLGDLIDGDMAQDKVLVLNVPQFAEVGG